MAKRKTHAGVLEFVADDGTVGLPPKVAASLFRQTKELPDSIQVRFVRLEKGKFASLQPRGDGFGNRQIDFKPMLERSMKAHTTLTEGGVLFVRHGKETLEVLVSELHPEQAVSILDTDLEVDTIPCEAVTKAKEVENRMETEAAHAKLLLQEKKQWKANKMATLVPEPSAEERLQAKVIVKTPEGQATRRFLHSSPLRSIFDFVEALSGEHAHRFQLATIYPRRLFGVEEADKTLQEVGLNSRQEALFVEKLAANEAKTEPVTMEKALCADQTSVSRPRTQLSSVWDGARQSLEQWLDKSTRSVAVSAIHAMEPDMPVAQYANQGAKWQAQSNELQQMGFMSQSLNIEVLERYQGHLLRVVNFLSEMATESVENGVSAMKD